MIRAATVAGRFVIPLILVATAACSGPNPSTNTPPARTADVSGTVAAQVQATVQAMGGLRNGSPSTPTSATLAAAPAKLAPTARVVPVALPIVLDEHFATPPQGWPDDVDGVAWHADGAYHLATRQDVHFVALGAPLIGALGDTVVSATFRKVGGPPGGGYGLIVRDQNTNSRDGMDQGGRFIVAEIGDAGTIGIWRREDDHWVDLVPWRPSAAVRGGDASNELTVQTLGDEITLLANGTQVAQVSMGLDKGGVGVFVGGDGNQVALEHFTVQSSAPTVPNSARAQTTATPAVTPTPNADVLLDQLDLAWAQERWPEALSLMDQIEHIAPTVLDFSDKRYAAHVAAGRDLLAKGDPGNAVAQFTDAQTIDPNRNEAKVALAALTPTPTVIPTSTPTAIPVRPTLPTSVPLRPVPVPTVISRGTNNGVTGGSSGCGSRGGPGGPRTASGKCPSWGR